MLPPPTPMVVDKSGNNNDSIKTRRRYHMFRRLLTSFNKISLRPDGTLKEEEAGIIQNIFDMEALLEKLQDKTLDNKDICFSFNRYEIKLMATSCDENQMIICEKRTCVDDDLLYKYNQALKLQGETTTTTFKFLALKFIDVSYSLIANRPVNKSVRNCIYI